MASVNPKWLDLLVEAKSAAKQLGAVSEIRLYRDHGGVRETIVYRLNRFKVWAYVECHRSGRRAPNCNWACFSPAGEILKTG